MSQGRSPRIVPPCPITVAIEEDCGRVIAYGVVVRISVKGAYIRTNSLLQPGATLRFRISFAFPPEVHELVGSVVWTQHAVYPSLKSGFDCGVEWRATDAAGRARLRQLAGRSRPGERPARVREAVGSSMEAGLPPE